MSHRQKTVFSDTTLQKRVLEENIKAKLFLHALEKVIAIGSPRLDHNCNTCASSLRPAGILLHSINRRQMFH